MNVSIGNRRLWRQSARALLVGVSLWIAAVGAAHAAMGWTDYGEITEFVQTPPGNGGEMVYITTTGTTNPHVCGPAPITRFYFAVSSEREKRMFAMVMAAKLAGKRIQVYVSGNCHASWPFSEATGIVME